MSILKLSVDTFASFCEKGGNYYLPLNWEFNDFRFINENSKKEKQKTKKKKKWIGESNTYFNYS